MRRATLACMLLACRSFKPAPVGDATPPRVAPVADASHATVLAAPNAREVVTKWNQAHNEHDSRALQDLYGPVVSFYGQSLTNRECVSMKKAAFDRSPDYAQSVKDISAQTEHPGLTVVRFTKTSAAGGKSTDYKAVLFLDAASLITYESDEVTNANIEKAKAATSTWCLDDPEGSFDSITNTKVIAPYRISARDAQVRANHSKHLADLQASSRGDFITIDIVSCPTRCDRAARACGYDMRVANHSSIGRNPSILVGWIYVDAIDGTLWWDDGASPRSEALAPLAQ